MLGELKPKDLKGPQGTRGPRRTGVWGRSPSLPINLSFISFLQEPPESSPPQGPPKDGGWDAEPPYPHLLTLHMCGLSMPV